jgi:hypothetical protein
MKLLVCQLIILLKGCIVLSLEASVSPNPFLRPGSQQKPPPPPVAKFTPKPIPQKDMSKEIEFRGYFILKGKPYFCLFNKKSNHAEWISLSENTYEEFQASEFNMESEVLTIIYEGSSYDITLLQGGSSIGPSKTNSIPVIPSSSNKLNSSASRTPTRYMPPRPKTAPQLPDWLVNKKTPSFPLPRNSSSSRTSGFSSRVPTRSFQGGGFSNTNRSNANQPKLGTPIQDLPNSVENKNNSQSNVPPSTVGNAPSDNMPVQDVSEPASQGNELDLDSLPPPPPPPNIVPPSPPPDIIPSREN